MLPRGWRCGITVLNRRPGIISTASRWVEGGDLRGEEPEVLHLRPELLARDPEDFGRPALVPRCVRERPDDQPFLGLQEVHLIEALLPPVCKGADLRRKVLEADGQGRGYMPAPRRSRAPARFPASRRRASPPARCPRTP
jgi:hypothetical protein